MCTSFIKCKFINSSRMVSMVLEIVHHRYRPKSNSTHSLFYSNTIILLTYNIYSIFTLYSIFTHLILFYYFLDPHSLQQVFATAQFSSQRVSGTLAENNKAKLTTPITSPNTVDTLTRSVFYINNQSIMITPIDQQMDGKVRTDNEREINSLSF